MLNLYVHCGSRCVDREDIENCSTPSRTNTWVPIAHHNLLRRVEHTLAGNGMHVINEAHALSVDRARYFGLLEVVNGRQPGTVVSCRMTRIRESFS